MKQLLFLLIVVALLSSCESKSGKLANKPVTASFTLTSTAPADAPKSITLDGMKGYQSAGVARLCGPGNEAWNVVVLKLYGVNDSVIYVLNSQEAKYLFLNFKK